MGTKSDHCLALSVSHSLIHSLTIKCCWELTDVTLACEDARVATDHFIGRSSFLWQNLAAMMPGQYQSHLSGIELCICSNRQTIVFSAICRDTLSISVWSEIIWKDVLSICLSKRALINLTARKSCLMHLSKLLHGFVNVVTGICQSPGFVVPLAMFMIVFGKKIPFLLQSADAISMELATCFGSSSFCCKSQVVHSGLFTFTGKNCFRPLQQTII